MSILGNKVAIMQERIMQYFILINLNMYNCCHNTTVNENVYFYHLKQTVKQDIMQSFVLTVKIIKIMHDTNERKEKCVLNTELLFRHVKLFLQLPIINSLNGILHPVIVWLHADLKAPFCGKTVTETSFQLLHTSLANLNNIVRCLSVIVVTKKHYCAKITFIK